MKRFVFELVTIAALCAAVLYVQHHYVDTYRMVASMALGGVLGVWVNKLGKRMFIERYVGKITRRDDVMYLYKKVTK